VADRIDVDGRCVGAEQRGLLVVEVLVHVHQVQVEEPALLAVDAQELESARSTVALVVAARVVARSGLRRERSA
jgi:hypothetical protein